MKIYGLEFETTTGVDTTCRVKDCDNITVKYDYVADAWICGRHATEIDAFIHERHEDTFDIAIFGE
jgi:hypothetical protein